MKSIIFILLLCAFCSGQCSIENLEKVAKFKDLHLITKLPDFARTDMVVVGYKSDTDTTIAEKCIGKIAGNFIRVDKKLITIDCIYTGNLLNSDSVWEASIILVSRGKYIFFFQDAPEDYPYARYQIQVMALKTKMSTKFYIK